MRAASKIQRWLAGICLALAVLMLALGFTVLARWLTSYKFLIYWTACTGLTAVAAFSALAEMLRLRRQLRQDQRVLIEETLRAAENDRNGKPGD